MGSFQVAAFITTPFDVVKTHQQIDLGEKEIFTGKKLLIQMLNQFNVEYI